MSSPSTASAASPAIKFFGTTCEYGMFSNMFPARFIVNGKSFPTNEHFFQAKKFESTAPAYFETIRQAANAKSAKALGKSRKHPIRKDWNDARIAVMQEGLRAKFSQHLSLKAKLLETGDRELIENAPRDYFWGCGAKGTGQNKLGTLLMELRKEFKEKSSDKKNSDETNKKLLIEAEKMKNKKETTTSAKAGKKEVVGQASPKAGKKK